MLKYLSCIALALCSFQSVAQLKKSKKFAKTITSSQLYDRLAVLASDSLEGRETGTVGQKKAANFIAKQFESFGLEAPVSEGNSRSYFQPFNLYKLNDRGIYISSGSQKLEYLKDLMSFGGPETSGEIEKGVVFLGDGTTLDSADLKGKLGAFYTTASNWREISENIIASGAVGTLVFMGGDDYIFSQNMSRMRAFMNTDEVSFRKPNVSTPNWLFFAPPSFCKSVFGKSLDSLKDSGQIGKNEGTIKMNVKHEIITVESENVLGFLPGTDLKDEIVVITSHYDHLGTRDGEVYNGADDDGSGTTSLLEIAEAFSIAADNGYRPRRSLLFMTVSGEEKGLLGSMYYTENPVFPLDKTVTNLNIDMVGRTDPEHEGKADYIYVIGADKLSSELHELSEMVNRKTLKLEFDYKYNSDSDPNRFYYRSDHYNFAKNRIPIIFYFNGVHEDYHQPTDTIEKIDLDLMKKRAQLVFYTAWALANRDNRVKLD